MGGWGSGWRGIRKAKVEESLVLSIKDLVRARVLVPGAYRRGSLTWKYHNGELEYESELRQDGTGSLFVRQVGAGKHFCHWVSLRSTVPNYGGRRWWFICPIKKIKVSKLYLPPGATKFASRKAHDLTYMSSQRCISWPRLARRLASRYGIGSGG